jgi:photosystem II stability/assembly factor-like uncharacterized protein
MILIGTDEGVYRWFEGCGWPIFHGLQGRAVVGLASGGPGVLVAVDRSGDVLETTDGGLQWRHVPLPAGAGRPLAVSVAGTPPTVVAALKPLSLYQRVVGTPVPWRARRVEGVAAWLDRARGLGARAAALVAAGRSRPRSDPEAARLCGWWPLNPPNAPRSSLAPEVRVLTIASGQGAAWFAAVASAGLWRSGDRGRTWEPCPGLPADVYAVRPSPGRPGAFWAATADGCRFTADGGQTWGDRGTGLDDARQVRAIAVHPGDPRVLLAGAAPTAPASSAAPRDGLGFALFESADSGQHWSRVARRTIPESFGFDTISDIAFDPAAPANVVVALGSGELWVTRNGGAYWEPLARKITAARVLCGVG